MCEDGCRASHNEGNDHHVTYNGVARQVGWLFFLADEVLEPVTSTLIGTALVVLLVKVWRFRRR